MADSEHLDRLARPIQGKARRGGEFAGLNEIEDLLEQRLTDRNESVMAGVITTDGMREDIFYSSHAEQATAKVEQLAAQIRAVRSQ